MQCGLQGASDILSDMLQSDLKELPAEAALPLARACAHYLNLTSIAEVHHRERNLRRNGINNTEQVLIDLLDKGFTPDQVYDCVASQKMEVVLTAHPTQVNRRSLLSKHNKIARLLAENDRRGC
jgi:phosphoenolpyruvate carboxylase